MGISGRLYIIEIFEDGKWREYFLGKGSRPLRDRKKLEALAQTYVPPNVTWRIVEAHWEDTRL